MSSDVIRTFDAGVFLGIDPGLSGALAAVGARGEVRYLRPMPVLQTKVGRSTRHVYDHHELRVCAAKLHATGVVSAVIERQQAMPQQGVTSMVTVGYGAGCLAQLLVDHDIRHEVVGPQVWQKVFSIRGGQKATTTTKDQARKVALDLFPSLQAEMESAGYNKAQQGGVVDAVLIAEYARRRFDGEV